MDNRRRTMEKTMDRLADHSLFHSPALKPIIHKLHSHCYYLFQSKNNNNYCLRKCNIQGFQSNRNSSVAFNLKIQPGLGVVKKRLAQRKSFLYHLVRKSDARQHLTRPIWVAASYVYWRLF